MDCCTTCSHTFLPPLSDTSSGCRAGTDNLRRENGTLETVGGFAKLKTMVDLKRAEYPSTFLVDGGDFAMGTLYQTIYETEAPELLLMGEIEYDATTFGNHEFDYRSKGLSNMLLSAVAHAKVSPDFQLPALVSANIDWSKNTSDDNLLIRSAMETYGSTPYTIVELWLYV